MRFSVLSMRKGIIASMQERFFCLALFLASAVAKTFGLLQDTSPSF
jgi:hypothetical protein